MKIVRGLAYYTGVVFEIFDRKGVLRAICGGGRYDRLFASLTDVDVPALGFGFGDVVLGELLKDRGLDRKAGRAVDAYVIGASGNGERVLEVAARIRASGRSAIYNFKGGSNVGKLLKAAASSGARHAVIVNESAERVAVKDLSTGEQREVVLAEFLAEG
jgi:histidyl-tRNA synthetase